MKSIKNFADLLNLFSTVRPRRKVAVVCPHDTHTMQVVDRCLQMHLAKFLLVCSEPSVWANRLSETSEDVEMIMTENTDEAARAAVAAVKGGSADVVMKGAINTDNLLHAVLDKEKGLLPAGRVLTHVTAAELPSYHKLLFFSDAAVIPQPDEKQFKAMVDYDVSLLRRLSITNIRIATIHFTEKINPRFPHTMAYQHLADLATEGRFGEGVTIEGPMDVKTACDSHSAKIKQIQSTVAGHADLLIFPNLTSANTFYKSISLFGGATMAGIICGAEAPIVIPSRADTAQSKLYSLALACIAQS